MSKIRDLEREVELLRAKVGWLEKLLELQKQMPAQPYQPITYPPVEWSRWPEYRWICGNTMDNTR